MIKQVIVIRKELKMRRGKEISQGAHAAMCFMTRRMEDDFDPSLDSKGNRRYSMSLVVSEEEKEWITGSFTKIVCQVETLAEIEALHEAALAAGLESNLMIDNGATEFSGQKTVTALAIGPAEASKIDAITGDLKLL